MTEVTYFFARPEHAANDLLDNKFASSLPPGSEQTVNDEAVPLRQFAGQYWFVELQGGAHKALSTEEVAESLQGGRTARSIGGPFDTRDDAEQCLERYWEMILDRNDDD